MFRSRAVTGMCAGVIALLASAAAPAAPALSAVEGGPAASTAAANTLMLVNVQTGKCLTIAGGVSTDNNVTALQYDCDAHPSRRWRLIDVTGTGQYQVRNVQTGKCLTIAGGVSTDNNVTALQYDCDAHPSRRWMLRLAGFVQGS